MKAGPRCHVPETEIISDDVTRKGSVVVEGTAVDDVAGAEPVVGQFVRVAKLPWEEKRGKCVI